MTNNEIIDYTIANTLWNGKGKSERPAFLCWALELTHRDTGANVQPLLDSIEAGLRPMSTVTGWLHRIGGVPDKHLTDANVQAYRIRWLESFKTDL